jgi:hypothetical protein
MQELGFVVEQQRLTAPVVHEASRYTSAVCAFLTSPTFTFQGSGGWHLVEEAAVGGEAWMPRSGGSVEESIVRSSDAMFGRAINHGAAPVAPVPVAVAPMPVAPVPVAPAPVAAAPVPVPAAPVPVPAAVADRKKALENPSTQRFMFLKLLRYLQEERSVGAAAAKANADSKGRLEELKELAKREVLCANDFELYMSLRAYTSDPRLRAAWDTALRWPHVQTMVSLAEKFAERRAAAVAKETEKRRAIEQRLRQKEQDAAAQVEHYQRVQREMQWRSTTEELAKATQVAEATVQRWRCALREAMAAEAAAGVTDVIMKTPHILVYDLNYPRDLKLGASAMTLSRNVSRNGEGLAHAADCAIPADYAIPADHAIPALPSCSSVQLALGDDAQLRVDGAAVPTPYCLGDARRRWWVHVIPCASRADAVGHILRGVIEPLRAAAAAAQTSAAAAFEDAAGAQAVRAGGGGHVVVYDVFAPQSRRQTASLEPGADVPVNHGSHFVTMADGDKVFVSAGAGTPWRLLSSRLELSDRMRISLLP